MRKLMNIAAGMDFLHRHQYRLFFGIGILGAVVVGVGRYLGLIPF